VFEGNLIGYPASSAGEVVFGTGMYGYPEALTDPSYKGQILNLTYPLQGNYGITSSKIEEGIDKNFESEKIHAQGLIISDYSMEYSHYSAVKSLSSWLFDNKVPGIYDIDTRKLTKILRENGTMLGKIIVNSLDIPFYDPNKEKLVPIVSPKEITEFKRGKKKVILLDTGAKTSILTSLLDRGVSVKRVPWNYDFPDEEYDGVLLSNGPGDPAMYPEIVENVKKLLSKNKPVLGICLGHQMLSMAAGASTYKLKYGHRSLNQPVQDMFSLKCYITSQNHGYAVNTETIPEGWECWFENLNDGTNEGIRHKTKPFMSVQFHPESTPGPVDTAYIFDEFINKLK